MKRFSQRHRLSTLSELNVTPLLDLAFVLLIIFMITTPLMEKSSDLIVPTSRAAGNAVPPSQTETISIDRNAIVKINNADVDAASLDASLAAFAAKHPGGAVIIRAHRDLPIQKVVDLQDALKRAGITKYSLVSADAQE